MKRFLRGLAKGLLILVIFLASLFVLFYFLTRGNIDVAKTILDDPTLPRLVIADQIFHGEVFGPPTGEVVIVIHGGPGNDYRYLLPLRGLADSYRMVFYDQRGTGLSPRVPDDQLSLTVMLGDLRAIVNHFHDGRPVHLIGHSWGAMLASGLIAAHPEKIGKVVLAEPGMLTTDKAREFMSRFRFKMSATLLVHLAKSWFEQLHVRGPDDQAGMDYFFTRIAQLDDPGNPLSGYFCNGLYNPDLLPYWRYSWRASRVIITSAQNEAGDIELDLTRGLEHFPRKVLFISGACNRIIGPDYQQDHLRAFPNAEMVVIDGAGHNMIAEKPAESMAIIRRYLSEPATCE